MNDFADQYDDSGIEEWLDIGGTGESHGSGWGVDEAAYTTQFSTAGLSRAQIEQAERIAREIEGEQRRGLDRFQGRRQQQTFAQGGGQEDKIESAEDALELWRRKKQQEEQQAAQQASLPQPPPGMGRQPPQQQYQQRSVAPPAQKPWDPNKERKALHYLGAQLGYCTGNVNKFGNPTPLQAKNLLHKFGKDLLTCLPFPPPDIRSAVLAYFNQVGWDVRQARPVPGSRPPNGTQIVGLVHELTKYFSARTGAPPPTMPILKIPQAKAPAPAPAPQQRKPVQRTYQTVSHAVQPQRGYGKGKGGNQYQNNRGYQDRGYQDRQKGQGGYYNRSHQGGKGSSYQQNRNYQNSNRQNYGSNNRSRQQQQGEDGFTVVGGRRTVNHSGSSGGSRNNNGGGRRY